MLCHLFYKLFEQFLRLPVNIGKIIIQPTAGQQIRIAHTMVLFEIAQVPLTPDSNVLFSLFILSGDQVVIADQFIL